MQPQPLPLSDDELAVLRQLAAPIDDDLRQAFLTAVAVELRRYRPEPALARCIGPRRFGDRVRITRGVFAGQLALFDGMRARERVEVLLQILGRVELPKGDIVSAQG